MIWWTGLAPKFCGPASRAIEFPFPHAEWGELLREHGCRGLPPREPELLLPAEREHRGARVEVGLH